MDTKITPIFVNHSELMERLSSDAVVITGNSRLSAYLIKSYDRWMLGKAVKAWETPNVLSWNAWLNRTFKEYYLTDEDIVKPVVISDSQERIIWEQIIKSSNKESVLLQTSATAKHAVASHKLIKHWDINLDEERQYLNDDALAFLSWLKQYRSKLKKQEWVASSDLMSCIFDIFKSKSLCSPKQIILTGFDELNIQQEQFLLFLQSKDCVVEWVENESKNQSVQCVQASQVREEIDWSARWARSLIEENKECRIAIVVPELKQLRDIIDLTFQNVFTPVGISPASSSVQKTYNISLGKPLSEYAFIETALSILRMKNVMDIEEMSSILMSPYIHGWSDELYNRSLLDQKIRQSGKLVVKLDYVLKCALNNSHFMCSKFVLQLEKLLTVKRALPSMARPSEWANLIAKKLDEIGFSKGRNLSSDEYQVAEAWNELLYELASLDNTCDLIQYSVALNYLTRFAGERVFQPKTNDAPIQILGVMEASGLEFDHLWIMGLHDAVWPPAPKPDPFIPMVLQRKKNVPHSSAEREFNVISKITKRLISSSSHVFISYPAMDTADILRPSPLLKEFEIIDVANTKRWENASWKQLIFKSSSLEKITDDIVPVAEGEILKGGSQIVRLQSLCPFRSFAELRLGARSVNKPTIGITPVERGSIIHNILEYIWNEILSHQELMKLTEDSLSEVISRFVSRVLLDYANKTSVDIPKHFMSLEKVRLERLMHDWLSIEKLRPAFKVLSTEQSLELNLGGIVINLKLDRVDELEQGGQLVIDYKTGNVSPSQWFGDRPQEPQLPLYSVAMPGKLSAVTFAQLQTGSFGFKGVAADKDLVPGVKSFQQLLQSKKYDSWSALLDEWQKVVETLADDFRQGNAAVDPLDFPLTCTYCNLTQLCRVNEVMDS